MSSLALTAHCCLRTEHDTHAGTGREGGGTGDLVVPGQGALWQHPGSLCVNATLDGYPPPSPPSWSLGMIWFAAMFENCLIVLTRLTLACVCLMHWKCSGQLDRAFSWSWKSWEMGWLPGNRPNDNLCPPHRWGTSREKQWHAQEMEKVGASTARLVDVNRTQKQLVKK